jgi:hypothetical protein
MFTQISLQQFFITHSNRILAFMLLSLRLPDYGR